MARHWSFALLILLLLCPALYVLVHGIMNFSLPYFLELCNTILPGLVTTSLYTVVGSILVALCLGFIPAWFLNLYKFPGKKLLIIVQLLPLTMPSNIVAGIYLEVFSQSFWESIPALSLELGANAAPWVFILTLITLQRIPGNLVESAKALGKSRWQLYGKLYFPLLLPTFFIASLLVLAQSLNDNATASTVGVTTYTVGLSAQWFALQNNAVASLLALGLTLAAVFVCGGLIYLLLKNPLANTANKGKSISPNTASVWQICMLYVLSVLSVLPGFLGPIYYVLTFLSEKINSLKTPTLFSDLASSLLTAISTVVVCAILGLIIAYTAKIGNKTGFWERASFILLLNYLIPSLVIAWSFLALGKNALAIPLLAWLAPLLKYLEETRGLIVVAAALKYFPFLLLPVMDRLAKIPNSLGESARSLGSSNLKTFFTIIFPAIKPGFLAGLLFIFIFSLQEINFSLLLNPFTYSSLSLQIFKSTDLHLIKDASFWIVTQVLICLYPIYLLGEYLASTGENNA